LLVGFADAWGWNLFGLSAEAWGWRLSMIAAGLVCAVTGVAYYFFTQDAPEGNFKDLRAEGKMEEPGSSGGSFMAAAKDVRVWALFLVYAACFGIELTMNNVAALYFVDYFDYFQNMDPMKAVGLAGLFATMFGLMNIFARTLRGMFGDRFGQRWGLSGRVKWLFIVLFCEGLALMAFSQANILLLAIPAMIVFSLFVQMAEGATFSVVPFVNKKALGSVAGIVGAGGNAGAVAAGFLFKSQAITWPTALFILGALVTVCSFFSFAVTFSPAAEHEARKENSKALGERYGEPIPAGA
jgi:NNP family nitrate/nitrite transporter-like MFS transporter